jgi:SAM-dependent methyltransferase
MTLPACLRCPTCLQPFTPPLATATHVTCTGGHAFPLAGGVVDLLGTPAPQTAAAVVNEWPLTAWAYERLWRPVSLSVLSGSIFPLTDEAALLQTLLPAAPQTILDVGCANGLYTRTLAAAYPHAHVIAVERAAPMLREAIRRMGTPPAVTWLRADAAALPIADASVDCIVSGGTFNECETLDAVLTTLARVAAPQATLCSMHLVDPRAIADARPGRSGVRSFAPTEIAARLTQTGWRVDHTITRGRVQFVSATRLP